MPTARISSGGLHPHVNLFGFILFCLFPTDNPNPESKKQEHPSPAPMEMQEPLDLIVHAKRMVLPGHQLALVSRSCPLNPGSHPLRTPNPRKGSSLTPPTPEKTEGWGPTGQLDLTSSQLTLWASALALLFFPSRDTQYRNSLSASSTLPRVAKACAFLKCAWKKT